MQRPTNRKQTRRTFFRNLRRALLGIGVGFVLTFTLFVVLHFVPLPQSKYSASPQLYDRNGLKIATATGVQRQIVVPLRKIAPAVVQATVAIEDRRFYTHVGLDLRGLARAIAVNVRAGRKVQGASTITQQLARNLYLGQEKTYLRKGKEALLALQLESHYSKAKILEQYLNHVYYGHGAYGIEAASQLYFAKPASRLSLAEAAMLVGLPKGPQYYSPLLNKKNAYRRQHVVLLAMEQQGLISHARRLKALEQRLAIHTVQPQSKTAAYFAEYVKQQAMAKLGLTEAQWVRSGYRVYTTLDLGMQQQAESVVAEQLAGSGLQTALVAMEPKSGEVRAMVGGKNFATDPYNRVFATSRQPGSAFKPLVYLTALHSRPFTVSKTFVSKPTVFHYEHGSKQYIPHNYNDSYANAPITMRQALMRSDNIYAVKTLMQVGAKKVVSLAHQIGIRAPLQALPALALGSSPISPFEMASAYAVIANQGRRAEPYAIIRIVNRQGRTVFRQYPSVRRVVDAQTAYLVTDLMQSVFEPGGTGYRVSDDVHRPTAAKTGTTNSDAWMIGFTPDLATAVWIGYDKGKPITTSDARQASPIFAKFMDAALRDVPPNPFPVPRDIVFVKIDPATGKRATSACTDSRTEPFVKGTEPTKWCPLHPILKSTNPPMQTQSPNDTNWWHDLQRWWLSP